MEGCFCVRRNTHGRCWRSSICWRATLQQPLLRLARTSVRTLCQWQTSSRRGWRMFPIDLQWAAFSTCALGRVLTSRRLSTASAATVKIQQPNTGRG